MVILLTAFEPFNHQAENASLDVLNHLDFQHVGVTIERVVLPVVYQDAIYRTLLLKFRPDVVLLMGEAATRQQICLEHRAMNVKKATIADNAGKLYSGEPIDEDGPLQRHDTIDSASIVASLALRGYPIALSESAGMFICNMAMYQTLAEVHKLGLSTKVGFIHWPRLSHQINPPGMPTIDLSVAVATLAEILKTIIEKK